MSDELCVHPDCQIEERCLWPDACNLKPTSPEKNKIVHAIFTERSNEEGKMVEAIKQTVYSFIGKVTVASTFGVIEIVKHELTKELL